LNTVRNELEEQDGYNLLFSDDNDFINEYEKLDITHRLVSFYPNGAKPFKGLRCGKTDFVRAVFKDEDIGAPIDKAKKIYEAYKSMDLRLSGYRKLFEEAKAIKQNKERLFSYARYMIGLAYSLIAPIANLDEESDILSPFRDDKSYGVRETMIFIHTTLYGYLTENAPEVMAKILSLDIYALYNEALFKYIAHARTKDRESAFVRNLNEFFNRVKKDLVNKGKNDDLEAQVDKEIQKLLRRLANDDERQQYKEDYAIAQLLLGNIKTIASNIDSIDNAISEAQLKTQQGKTQRELMYQSLQSSPFYQRSIKFARLTFGLSALYGFYNLASSKEAPKPYQIAWVIND
jgi:uncharacterized protein YdaU (DUF1376 family)